MAPAKSKLKELEIRTNWYESEPKRLRIMKEVRVCHLLYHSQNDLKIGTNQYESKLNGPKS